MKGVIDIRSDSRYNDTSTSYQFPSQYLNVFQNIEGDWVLHKTTRRGAGESCYVGFSMVSKIVRDPTDSSMYYANLEYYTPFSRKVPFKNPSSEYCEKELNKLDHSLDVGRHLQGKSVRVLEELEFAAIVTFGFEEIIDPINIPQQGLDLSLADSLQEIHLLHDPVKQSRRIIQTVVNRPFRDATFRYVVLKAYENQCAITGLKIINGQGRVEAEAAHIQAVSEGGPDAPNNGIALSGTCHWLFDRHLISVTDDYELLVSPNIPQRLRRLFPQEGEKVFVPKQRLLQPSSTYLEFHRETFENKLHT